MRKLLAQLQLDLLKLDRNELTVVTYDYSTHELQLNQVGISIYLGYLGLYYNPPKTWFKKSGLKIGVLNQFGLNSLLRDLEDLLASNLIDNNQFLPRAEILGISFYRKLKDTRIPYPVKMYHMNFMNISNSILCSLVCRRYSSKSRVLYKTIKNSIKNEKKSTDISNSHG